jgi:hypothetical protein
MPEHGEATMATDADIFTGQVDLPRMRRQRYSRLQAEMGRIPR